MKKTLILAAALGGTVLSGTVATAAIAQTGTPAPAAATDAPPPPPPHHRGPGMGRMGGMMADADRDGTVTRAEAIADADRRFAAMDLNHDGKVTEDERRTARDQRRAAFAAQRAGATGTPGAPPPPPPPPGGPAAKPPKDRVVTQAEFRDRALKMFDRMDANKDGTVDANERAAFRMTMRARMGDRFDAPPPPPPATAPQQ